MLFRNQWQIIFANKTKFQDIGHFTIEFCVDLYVITGGILTCISRYMGRIVIRTRNNLFKGLKRAFLGGDDDGEGIYDFRAHLNHIQFDRLQNGNSYFIYISNVNLNIVKI